LSGEGKNRCKAEGKRKKRTNRDICPYSFIGCGWGIGIMEDPLTLPSTHPGDKK